MKKTNIIYVLFMCVLTLAGCSEKIDEDKLYSFNGQMIEDFLSADDNYANFNYILKRVEMDKLLSAYGTYTCFAPTNDAVTEYVDSLYDDEQAEIPHNGMTSRSLEGLTDSLCTDIARFHLAATKVNGIDMGSGLTITTMLGRELNTAIDESGATCVNTYSRITSMDNEVENGVVHVIDHVLRRSNRLVAGEMEQHEEYGIFLQALRRTGLADSLCLQLKEGLKEVTNNTDKLWVPEECKIGYTVFAETDDVMKANGINSIDDLTKYANEQYGKCAEQGSGWYDYYRNHNIEVSTGTDYQNSNNALNMFVRYHILKYAVSASHYVYHFNEGSDVDLFEYYQTMLPYTMFKLIEDHTSGVYYINRQVSRASLSDVPLRQGSDGFHEVVREGVVVQKVDVQATNGYIHPLNDMLVYDAGVPHVVLNERMRFDDSSLLPALMSNGIRGITAAEVRAHVPVSNASWVRFSSNYFDNLVVFNEDNSIVRYLPKDCVSSWWCNYQGDELLCIGLYDFAIKLPPVPDGVYELRMNYTANNLRGMVQFYLSDKPDKSSMQAIDIPLDMRLMGENPNIGWTNYLAESDMGIATDKAMRNRGYMRGPLYFRRSSDSDERARAHDGSLRRIITRRQFQQGELWLRCKSVLQDNTSAQFHLDCIELVPVNVYNNADYSEDMY